MNDWINAYKVDPVKLDQVLELLSLQYKKTYAQFNSTLENLVEVYIDKKNDDSFSKI